MRPPPALALAALCLLALPAAAAAAYFGSVSAEPRPPPSGRPCLRPPGPLLRASGPGPGWISNSDLAPPAPRPTSRWECAPRAASLATWALTPSAPARVRRRSSHLPWPEPGPRSRRSLHASRTLVPPALSRPGPARPGAARRTDARSDSPSVPPVPAVRSVWPGSWPRAPSPPAACDPRSGDPEAGWMGGVGCCGAGAGSARGPGEPSVRCRPQRELSAEESPPNSALAPGEFFGEGRAAWGGTGDVGRASSKAIPRASSSDAELQALGMRDGVVGVKAPS